MGFERRFVDWRLKESVSGTGGEFGETGEDAEATRKLLETHSKRRGGKSGWNGRETEIWTKNGRGMDENGCGVVSPKYLLLTAGFSRLRWSRHWSRYTHQKILIKGS